MSEEKLHNRQSGMEGKHEEWVNATVNFLHQHNVQTYSKGWNANSLEGMSLPKGEVLEIPERLKLLSSTIRDNAATQNRISTALWREEDKFRTASEHLKAAEDELELLWGMIGDGIDMDALQQDDTLEALLRKRRPHLFEEEEEDAEPTKS
jgi:hypothetical protein